MSELDLLQRGLIPTPGQCFTELESILVIGSKLDLSERVKLRDTLNRIKGDYGLDKYNTIFESIDWRKPTSEEMKKRVDKITEVKPEIKSDELINEDMEGGEDFEDVTDLSEEEEEMEDWEEFVDTTTENEGENEENYDLRDDFDNEDKSQEEDIETTAIEDKNEENDEEELEFENESEEKDFYMKELRKINVLVAPNWGFETVKRKYEEKILNVK